MFSSTTKVFEARPTCASNECHLAKGQGAKQLDDGIGLPWYYPSQMARCVSVQRSTSDFPTAVDTKVWAIPWSNCAVHFVLAQSQQLSRCLARIGQATWSQARAIVAGYEARNDIETFLELCQTTTRQKLVACIKLYEGSSQKRL